MDTRSFMKDISDFPDIPGLVETKVIFSETEKVQMKKKRKSKRKYVFFGVGTTGSSTVSDEIIQILAIGPESKEFHRFVAPSGRSRFENPDLMTSYDRENGFKVMGKQIDQTKVVPDISTGLKEFHQWLKSNYNHQVVLCSYNGKDHHFKFLRKSIDKNPFEGAKDMYPVECIDIKELVRSTWVFPDGYDLTTAFKHVCGYSIAKPHLEVLVGASKLICIFGAERINMDAAKFIWRNSTTFLLDEVWVFDGDDAFGKPSTMIAEPELLPFQYYEIDLMNKAIHHRYSFRKSDRYI